MTALFGIINEEMKLTNYESNAIAFASLIATAMTNYSEMERWGSSHLLTLDWRSNAVPTARED